jgi:hypothetical protein
VHPQNKDCQQNLRKVSVRQDPAKPESFCLGPEPISRTMEIFEHEIEKSRWIMSAVFLLNFYESKVEGQSI